ncbi:MAG TPA: aminotransferase class I/II-fold pyridoxal phosphate-dependent enzyme [Acidobacteriota bacterium]|nr:aminotransferase class I/II-fold pyridoxal phosphate-dependent enzyme [Acidobacteriota bacterium]
MPGIDDAKGAVVPPIYQSATFRFASTAAAAARARGESDTYIYTRYTNPTLEAVEAKLAALERGARAFLFASGSAATATWCHAFLRPGDRLIAADQLYGGTAFYFDRYLSPLGIRVERVPFTDLDRLAAALAGAKAAWFETPTNPTLRIVDGPAVAELCRKHDVLSAVDNTFATPINQKPLSWGVDWVMHSATKYLGGHADVIGGVLIAGAGADVDSVYQARLAVGGVMDPHAAFLVDRGLKTLALRVERHNANAARLARWLSERAEIARVHYPGLPDHPGHQLAARQMRGFGGMLAVDLKGGYDAAAHFVDRLQVIVNAASLGGVESLASLPVLTSHARAGEDELQTAGITRGTVRISVGIESLDDLIADVEQALSDV